jgi:hypothetical protein
MTLYALANEYEDEAEADEAERIAMRVIADA